MGADLVLNILEISKSREPDWDAATCHLMQQSDDTLEEIAADLLDHYDEDEDDDEDEDEDEDANEREAEADRGEDCESVSETKTRFLRALDSVASCWLGDSRNAIKYDGAETSILIVGGTTVGEPFLEIYDVEALVASGMAKAAGFIVGDAG